MFGLRPPPPFAVAAPHGHDALPFSPWAAAAPQSQSYPYYSTAASPALSAIATHEYLHGADRSHPYVPPFQQQQLLLLPTTVIPVAVAEHDDEEDKDGGSGLTVEGPYVNKGKFGAALTMLIGHRLYCVKTPTTAGSFLPSDFVREVFLAQAFVDPARPGHRTSPFVLPFRDVFFGPNHNTPDQRPSVHVAYDFAPDRDMVTWINTAQPSGAELFRTMLLVLHGLRDLHAHGIVHGDFKPANVLVVSGWPLIADLGGAGVVNNVEPDIVDKYYSDPDHETRNEYGDVYAYMRLIHKALELRAFGGQSTGRDHRFAADTFAEAARLAGFSAEDSSVLWYMYATVVNFRQVTAQGLLESVQAIFNLHVDMQPPMAVLTAQSAFSPFTDEHTLRGFMSSRAATAQQQQQQQWRLAGQNLVQCAFGAGDDYQADMAEYLVDKDPVSVLTVLTCNILDDAARAGVALDAAAVIAAVQIATHTIGHQGKGSLEELLVRRWQHLYPTMPVALDDVYQWEMAIVVGLWFGPVHTLLLTRWSSGLSVEQPACAAAQLRPTRQLYLPPPDDEGQRPMVIGTTDSFAHHHQYAAEQPQQQYTHTASSITGGSSIVAPPQGEEEDVWHHQHGENDEDE